MSGSDLTDDSRTDRRYHPIVSVYLYIILTQILNAYPSLGIFILLGYISRDLPT